MRKLSVFAFTLLASAMMFAAGAVAQKARTTRRTIISVTLNPVVDLKGRVTVPFDVCGRYDYSDGRSTRPSCYHGESIEALELVNGPAGDYWAKKEGPAP